MSENLVTVGTFSNTTEAALVANRLRDADILAVISDDFIVTADFLLGNAIGWIKVQVPDDAFERAMDLLEVPVEPVPVEEIPWDQPNEEDADLVPEEKERIEEERRQLPPPDAPVSEDELLTNRAYRIAIAGLLLFPPLPHFFVLYLLLKIASGGSELSVRATIRYYAALFISLGMIMLGLVTWSIIRYSD